MFGKKQPPQPDPTAQIQGAFENEVNGQVNEKTDLLQAHVATSRRWRNRAPGANAALDANPHQ